MEIGTYPTVSIPVTPSGLVRQILSLGHLDMGSNEKTEATHTWQKEQNPIQQEDLGLPQEGWKLGPFLTLFNGQ
jgi:hypothetical protein